MPAPQQHDCAVVFCCDRKYYRFALFMIRQLAFHNPDRRFDFVVVATDDLSVPDWAAEFGIVLHRPGTLPPEAEAARLMGSLVPIYRNMLARELGDRYRRILYLDCDMFIEGGDINRLLEVDIGQHPIGAALDAPYFFRADFRADEYRHAGLSAMPYCNTGLQLIDTRAYREQDVERRSFDVCKNLPHAITQSDQSMTNLALRGKFAQLAPAWNWQLNGMYPLVPMRHPVFIRHFVSGKKPDRDSEGWHEARFLLAYREFFTQFMPEELPTLAAPAPRNPMALRDVWRIAIRHLRGMALVDEMLSRYPDPYCAII